MSTLQGFGGGSTDRRRGQVSVCLFIYFCEVAMTTRAGPSLAGRVWGIYIALLK